MKCPHCGSPIGLEDEFCSFCGQPNTLAQKHQKDMKHYQQEFSKTQQEVYANTRRFTSLTGPVIILFVLLVLNIAGAFFVYSAWDIGSSMTKKKIEKNEDKYRAEMETFITNKDYWGLSSYFSRNSLYLADCFDEYDAVVTASDYCYYTYQILSNDANFSEKDSEALSSTITSLTKDLDGLFNVEENYTYRKELCLSDEKRAIIKDVQSQAQALLVTYIGLSPEEAQELPNYSAAKQREILEGRIINS
jgi:hypothetical protein